MPVIYTGGLWALWARTAPRLQLDRWSPQDGFSRLALLSTYNFAQQVLLTAAHSAFLESLLLLHTPSSQELPTGILSQLHRLSFDISVKASMTSQVLHSTWLQNQHYLDVAMVFCLHKLFLGPLKPWLAFELQGSESSGSSVVQGTLDLTYLKYWNQIFISTSMNPRWMG